MDPDFLVYWWKSQSPKKKMGYYFLVVTSLYISIKVITGA